MTKKLLATLVVGGLLFQWQGVSCIGIPVAGNLPYQLTQLATGALTTANNTWLQLVQQLLGTT